ncbi:hypothetical protein GCM10010532_068840 [Dactylosporangium siamense]
MVQVALGDDGAFGGGAANAAADGDGLAGGADFGGGPELRHAGSVTSTIVARATRTAATARRRRATFGATAIRRTTSAQANRSSLCHRSPEKFL